MNILGKVDQQEKQITHTWAIDDFCDIRKHYSSGQFFYSPVFYTDVKSKWRLQLYPQGEKETQKGYISIFAHYMGDNTVNAVMTYSVMSGTEELNVMQTSSYEFKKNATWGYKTYLRFDDIQAKLLRSDNKLIIKCKIAIDEKGFTSIQTNTTEIDLTIDEYNSDFEKLLNNNIFSDVILTAGDEKIYAHKNILATKSAVFAAIFEHDMTEKRRDIVEVKDVTPSILKEMLRYLYAGKVNCIIDIARDLLVAANKYLLESLKNMCEESLCENVSSSNVIEYLKFAENNNAPKLKAQAIQYIVSNAETIINDPEFKLYCKLDSVIINEIFQTLVTQRINKKAK